MTEANFLIDSNILVYAYDIDEKEKNRIAKKLLWDVLDNKKRIVLSTQNLSEFYVSVTKKINKPISFDEAKEIIEEFVLLPNIEILNINKPTVLDAIEISSEFKISYWDALIAAAMKENDVKIIITENDKDFKKIRWLNVVNPFKKK